MNRTELAQALISDYTSLEYNVMALMLNKVTDKQFNEFVKIYNRVKQARSK